MQLQPCLASDGVLMVGAARIAIALGYIGSQYHGSQVQPNVVTVQGLLQEALHSLGWADSSTHPITLSSRTDAGVDARMNIGSFDVDSTIWENAGEKGIIVALNDHLPLSIRVWAAEKVDSEFRARDASSRTYLYRLQAMKGWKEVDVEELKQWCSMFEGEHDFANFCRTEDGRPTVRVVQRCEPWLDGDGGILGFRIKGASFVWNQVRRIASVLCKLAGGRLTLKEVENALHNVQERVVFGLADSKWLSLWSIEHKETPHLNSKVESFDEIFLHASTAASGRLYPIWAEMARLEQDCLHYGSWINQLELD